MGRMFGTDGVRGIANAGLSGELAFKLGQASAEVLTGEVHRAKILIGMDTRISADMLEFAMVAGICSAGVVISASHNSFEYNGIKIFNRDGYKLADEIEDQIEHIVKNGSQKTLPTGLGVGRRVKLKNGIEEYIKFLSGTTAESLSGLKIALDCANGAASMVAPEVFRRLGAEVICFYNSPDGTNINDNCGSTHPENLSRLVSEMGADIGLAFDGDADRLIAIDEFGRLINGDRVMAINAIDLKERGLLKKDVLCATVMSNLGLELGLKERGITVVKTDVGDRYVLEEMLKNGYSLGGEQSGHVIFLDHNTTGDGILTGIQLASVLKRKQKSLSELANVISILPQVLVNAKVSEDKKHCYTQDQQIMEKISSLEEQMHGRGRVLIRPSGTEPLVRVMIEGEDRDYIEKQASDIAKLIETKLS